MCNDRIVYWDVFVTLYCFVHDIDQSYKNKTFFGHFFVFPAAYLTSGFQCSPTDRKSTFVLNPSLSAPRTKSICGMIFSSNAGSIALIISVYKVFQRSFTVFHTIRVEVRTKFLGVRVLLLCGLLDSRSVLNIFLECSF